MSRATPHDAEGNRTQTFSTGDGTVVDYIFDHRNRLTQVSQASIVTSTDGWGATAGSEVLLRFSFSGSYCVTYSVADATAQLGIDYVLEGGEWG